MYPFGFSKQQKAKFSVAAAQTILCTDSDFMECFN